MDLKSMLNEPTRPDAGATARQFQPPQRSASLAQPPSHNTVQPHPPPNPPLLARQQSYPAYIHVAEQYPGYAQPPQPHTSYSPHRDEYFRSHSLSVSPKTLPGAIPQEPAPSPRVLQGQFQHEPQRLDSFSASTPVRSHTREHSIHSVISNHSSHRDPLSARDYVAHSPQLMHAASVTSSPIQARAPDYHNYSNLPIQSPVDVRATSHFRMPTHSPIQAKAMPPPITPVITQQPSPPPHPIQTPTRQSPITYISNSRSASLVPQVHSVSEETELSRKRSLESTGEQMSPPPKRPRRYEQVPPWACRAEWRPQQEMEQWIPMKRSPVDRPAEVKAARVPAASPEVKHSRISQNDDVKGNGPPATVPIHTNGSNHAEDNRTHDFAPVGSFELSLDNQVPYSDITRQLSQFFFENVVMAPPFEHAHMEVEAKLGTIVDSSTGDRMSLPVTTEVVIHHDYPVKFQSSMSIGQHKAMNDYLNVETERAGKNPERTNVVYQHLREIDSFYPAPRQWIESLDPQLRDLVGRHGHTPRVRVTKDAQTQKIKAIIMKVRIEDLHIFCPRDVFDIRISVSLEIDYTGPIELLNPEAAREGDSSTRFKDRLSYQHQFVSIDLTQVRVDGGSERRHELELEFDTNLLQREGYRVQGDEPNQYEGIVGIFTNYIRVINRTCRA